MVKLTDVAIATPSLDVQWLRPDLRSNHDDVIKWKHFPRYWLSVRGIQRTPVNSPHKDRRRRALRFSLIFAWTNSWANNGDAGDLRRNRAHYNVIVMLASNGADAFEYGIQITSLTIVYFNRLFRRRSKKTPRLHVTGLCVGNSPVNSQHKWPVTRKMFPFDDVIMNTR